LYSPAVSLDSQMKLLFHCTTAGEPAVRKAAAR
jgi:hypothetical protein